MEERRKCTSVRQLELMVEFLEGHRDLALGRVRSKEARAVAAQLWRECAESLNAEGPARTGKEWAKVWNDHKCRVRAKLVSINAPRRTTGLGRTATPTLTPLEDRVANILGRDIGPLSGVRQDQFTFNINDDDMVMELEPPENPQDIEIEPSVIVLTEAVVHPVPEQIAASPPPVHVQPLPDSPVPSLTGQAPSTQSSPRRTPGVRRVRERRRRDRASIQPITPVRTQPGRTALEESRLMILHIEEMRAEAALKTAEAVCSFSNSFKLIAESIDRVTQKYCQVHTTMGSN